MRYVFRRLGFYVISAWAAITMNFMIPRLMPGNPIEVLIAREKGRISSSALQALSIAFGLNTKAGLFRQYVSYWVRLFHGNLGLSITYYPASVVSVIEAALPWTIVLIGLSTVVSFALGTALGVLVGWRRGSWLDSLLPATTFFSSVPYFWLALIALTIFGVTLGWFPISGGYSPATEIGFNGAFIVSAVYHGVLPAITIVVSSVAGWLLGMRNMMVTTLAEDYITLAEAKGLGGRRVMFIYAARNAILPSIASFAMSLGFIVSGAVLVEVVFSYPGVGYLLFEGVSNEDYPLMQGIFLIITLAVLVANLLADLVYVALDPRTRQEA